jgi:hypothetical protein
MASSHFTVHHTKAIHKAADYGMHASVSNGVDFSCV